LAAQIATDSDGLPCSVKTVYAVAKGLVKSARVSDALRRAEMHPAYRRWLDRQLEDAQRQFEKAKRQLREAKRLLNPEDRAA
jgi:acyl-CoA hydrolase